MVFSEIEAIQPEIRNSPDTIIQHILLPIPLQVFQTFNSLPESAKTEANLNILKRAVDQSPFLFRDSEESVSRKNQVIQPKPDSLTLASRTIYLEGFPTINCVQGKFTKQKKLELFKKQLIVNRKKKEKDQTNSGQNLVDFSSKNLKNKKFLPKPDFSVDFTKLLPDKKFEMIEFISQNLEILMKVSSRSKSKPSKSSKSSASQDSKSQNLSQIQPPEIAYMQYNQKSGYCFIEFVKNVGDLNKICKILNSHEWRIPNPQPKPLNFDQKMKAPLDQAIQPKTPKFYSFYVKASPFLTWRKTVKKCQTVQTNSYQQVKSHLASSQEAKDSRIFGLTFEDDTVYTIKADSDGGEDQNEIENHPGTSTSNLRTFEHPPTTRSICSSMDLVSEIEEPATKKIKLTQSEDSSDEGPSAPTDFLHAASHLSRPKSADSEDRAISQVSSQAQTGSQVKTTSTAPIFNLNLVYFLQDTQVTKNMERQLYQEKLKFYRRVFYKYSLNYIDFSYVDRYVYLLERVSVKIKFFVGKYQVWPL